MKRELDSPKVINAALRKKGELDARAREGQPGGLVGMAAIVPVFATIDWSRTEGNTFSEMVALMMVLTVAALPMAVVWERLTSKQQRNLVRLLRGAAIVGGSAACVTTGVLEQSGVEVVPVATSVATVSGGVDAVDTGIPTASATRVVVATPTPEVPVRASEALSGEVGGGVDESDAAIVSAKHTEANAARTEAAAAAVPTTPVSPATEEATIPPASATPAEIPTSEVLPPTVTPTVQSDKFYCVSDGIELNYGFNAPVVYKGAWGGRPADVATVKAEKVEVYDVEGFKVWTTNSFAWGEEVLLSAIPDGALVAIFGGTGNVQVFCRP